MEKSFYLFCPNCSRVLVTADPPHMLSICSSCGSAINPEQRTLQKMSLPFDLQISTGLAAKGNHLWAWGTQNGQVQLFRIDSTSSKIQAKFPVPNNWQLSGLAMTEKVLILAPREPTPPGTSKALTGIQPNTGKVLWA